MNAIKKTRTTSKGSRNKVTVKNRKQSEKYMKIPY